MGQLRDYYTLTKPGIVYGNLIHAIAGGLLGVSVAGWHWAAFTGGILGTALLVAAGCVFNNIIDRHIDARMARTKRRALVVGSISLYRAMLIGLLLTVIGASVLILLTPPLVLCIGAVALVWYVVIYGWAKRTTPLSTLIGSVPGALPPVAGYCALTGVIDLNAILLFGALVAWQMPHFHAIGIYRRSDYAAAKLPIMASKLTNRQLAWIMALYGVIYCELIFGMIRTGLFHPVPGGIFLLCAVAWTLSLARGIIIPATGQERWARQGFMGSLLLSVAFLTLSAINLVFS